MINNAYICMVFVFAFVCIFGGNIMLFKPHHRAPGIVIVIISLLYVVALIWFNISLNNINKATKEKEVISTIKNKPQYYITYNSTVSNEITKYARPGIYTSILMSIVNSDLPSDIIVRLDDDIINVNGTIIVPRTSILEVCYDKNSSITFNLIKIIKPTGEVINFNNEKTFIKPRIKKPILFNVGTQGVFIIE